MDKLEKFFKNNKANFDYISEDANGWEDMNRLLDKSSEKSSMQRPRRYIGLWVAGAAAAVLLLIGFFNQSSDDIEPVYTDMVSLIGLDEDQYFPDLTLQNPEGEMIPLSALNAQVVLVDFWASSCMVCNEENCYYFKPLYNEYKSKGFEIYSVSMDSSAISWQNAIQRDGLEWVQVSDLKGFDSPVMEQYEVEALPTNYLLDSNGKIIAKNIDVADLEGELDAYFAMGF
ncbi:MAG: peroxiredoxin family protein [Saprospiraceae bacterium]